MKSSLLSFLQLIFHRKPTARMASGQLMSMEQSTWSHRAELIHSIQLSYEEEKKQEKRIQEFRSLLRTLTCRFATCFVILFGYCSFSLLRSLNRQMNGQSKKSRRLLLGYTETLHRHVFLSSHGVSLWNRNEKWGGKMFFIKNGEGKSCSTIAARIFINEKKKTQSEVCRSARISNVRTDVLFRSCLSSKE